VSLSRRFVVLRNVKKLLYLLPHIRVDDDPNLRGEIMMLLHSKPFFLLGGSGLWRRVRIKTSLCVSSPCENNKEYEKSSLQIFREAFQRYWNKVSEMVGEREIGVVV